MAGFETFIVIVIVIFFLVLFGAVGFLVYIYRKEPKDDPTAPIIIIHDTRYADGKIVGSLAPPYMQEGTDGRVAFFYMPKDLGINEPKIPNSYLCEKNKIMISSKGSWSKAKTIINVYPSKTEYLPEIDKKMGVGDLIETWNVNKTELDALREGFQRMKKIKKQAGEGEFTASELGRIHSLTEQSFEKLIKGDKKQPPMGGRMQ